MKSAKALVLLFCVTSLFAFTPNNIPVKLTWETLRDVTFKKKWYAEESIYMLHPTFGPSVQKLKNQQVSITGYILPVDLDANLYVLSAFPFSACFFLRRRRTRDGYDFEFQEKGWEEVQNRRAPDFYRDIKTQCG